MKENINFDNSNSISDINETELLRKDAKSLIYSLKKHQDVVKESFSKLKDENNQYNLDQDEHDDPPGSEYELKYSINLQKEERAPTKISYYLDARENQPPMNYPDPIKADSRTDENYYEEPKTSSSIKTVSFNEFLLGKSVSNRRSRSASPHLKKTPTKSILKKQLVQDELSDESTNDDLNSSSNSTNSLLCSDIYGDFEKNFDFTDDLGEEMFSGSCLDMEQSSAVKANPKKFIELVSKKRQGYLNHCYAEAETNNEIMDDVEAVTNSENQGKESQIKKPSKIPIKKTNSDKNSGNAWTRSKSADFEKQKLTMKQVSSSQTRLNRFQKNKKGLSPTTTTNNDQAKSQANLATTKSTDHYKSKMKVKLASSLNPKASRDYKKLASQVKKSKQLLGYDWALDNAETNSNTTKTPKPEEYWQELSKFRSQNKDECVSTKQPNFDGSSTSFFETGDSKMDLTGDNTQNIDRLTPDNDGRSHKCIHSYTLNDRLFPVPVYKGKNGQSVCPVCTSGRKEATNFTPQFCKVSIPKSRIMEPYKIQFNKEVSEDSVSLAGNCKAGYQSSAPKKTSFSKPTNASKNIDLKSASGISNDISKLTIDDVKRIKQNRDPVLSGVYNKAHAMRYELEDQHQKRLRDFAT